MAKVISLFKISGTIGDLTFRQTKDGPVAQMKPGPTRERVLDHERFRNTRLNAAEFKLAIAEGKLLRDALGMAKEGMRVASLNGRMNGLFFKARERDQENCRGERRASNGNVQLLTDFDFNKDLLLANALPPGITHQLDAATGVLKVELTAFIARKKKGFPKEATHFRIVSGGAVIDFTKRSYRRDVKVSELLPLRKKTPEVIGFEHTLETGAGEVLVQVLGIQLYKLEDGIEELLPGGAMRILEAVKVGEGKEGLEGIEALEGNEATRHKGNEEEGLLMEEELHELEGMAVETGKESELHELSCRAGEGRGMEALLEDVGARDEVQGGEGLSGAERSKEEAGEAPLEVGLLGVDEFLPEGTAGPGRAVRRRRRPGRCGVGRRRQGGNKATRHRVAGREGGKGYKEVGIGVRERGRKRLLFCRSSVDLHYICNPSDGTSWQPEVREEAGAPGMILKKLWGRIGFDSVDL